MAWSPLREPVNYVLFAQQRTPGLAYITKAGSHLKIEQIQGYGFSGAVLRCTGDKLSEFDVHVQLWTNKDWDDWGAFLPIIEKPPRGTRPKAIDIWHPILEMFKIRSCQVSDIHQPNPIEDGTVYEAIIACKAFRKPRPMLSQLDAAKSTITDPYDRVIENLTGQLNALAGGGDGQPLGAFVGNTAKSLLGG